MRTAKFALTVLLVLLAICLLNLRLLDRCISETTRCLETAQTLAQSGDLAAAALAVEQAQRIWDRWETFLGSVARHDELDELRYTFARLPGFAADNNSDEFRAQCAELIARVKHIREMERPSLHNILSVTPAG